jgi:hypothetical protein
MVFQRSCEMSVTKLAAGFRLQGRTKNYYAAELAFPPISSSEYEADARAKSLHRMMNLAEDVPIDYEHYPKSNIRQ